MRTINPLNLFSQRLAAENTASKASPTPSAEDAAPEEHEEKGETAEREGQNPIQPEVDEDTKDHASSPSEKDNEKTALLGRSRDASKAAQGQQVPIVKRIASAVVGSFTVVFAAVLAPGRWLIACFYSEQGAFSAAMPFKRIRRTISPRKRHKDAPSRASTKQPKPERTSKKTSNSMPSQEASAITSESELESEAPDADTPARNTRSKSHSPASNDESDAPKKSIRIKAVNEEELRRRKKKRAQDQDLSGIAEPPLTVATIKSPTSSTSALKLTRYPRAPVPPRPLIPRRQPSYSLLQPPASTLQKTLVIDLDETLIHSMAKGGRMSTGHMVEVKLSSPVGAGNHFIAPQVPILYYVHKRPHCDEFLRKISKWYNLIVFTASVQEYADPVIDWLELERKYFSARYYRQHCTYRNGAYIKDLSRVEPDLSKVMILDNSPISYIFHEDNAIPIEGWISDPTDNDLLHLIPLLEGLQHTTDVRALLNLRLGESST